MKVSVPLRGIGSEKHRRSRNEQNEASRLVSVPLRGIGSEKQPYQGANPLICQIDMVSVPLRGIGSEKPREYAER